VSAGTQRRSERRSFVVDASVIVRWELRNRPYLIESLRVWDDYSFGEVILAAPTNLLVEVSGAIHHGMVTRLVSPEQAEQRIIHVLSLEILTIEASDLLIPAHRFSRRFGCSFYDSLYLAAADRTGFRFVHADRRLRETLAGRFPLELWIEQYSSDVP
jgi:predicted nucleic acid-binding protein